jgi:hypothetical protein
VTQQATSPARLAATEQVVVEQVIHRALHPCGCPQPATAAARPRRGDNRESGRMAHRTRSPLVRRQKTRNGAGQPDTGLRRFLAQISFVAVLLHARRRRARPVPTGPGAPARRLHAAVAARLDELLAARAPGLAPADRARCGQVSIQNYKAMLPVIAAASPRDQVLLVAEL